MRNCSGTTGGIIALFIWASMQFFHSCAPQGPEVLPNQPATPDTAEQTLLTEHKNLLVRSGLEVFLAKDHSSDTLRYGLLTNQTSVNRDLEHAVHLLPPVIDLQLLLSPEHGLYGAENAGDKIEDDALPN